MTESPRALALVGMPGAGKTLCAAHLEQRGYAQFRFGSIVIDELLRRGLVVNPENERIVREDLRAKEGMEAIAIRSIPILKNLLASGKRLVIDGLYGFGEYKLLHADLGASMCVVAITSARHLRYQRLANRPDRPLTPAEAEARDRREIEHLEKGGPIAIADFTLLNNGDTDALLNALDTLTHELGFLP